MSTAMPGIKALPLASFVAMGSGSAITVQLVFSLLAASCAFGLAGAALCLVALQSGAGLAVAATAFAAGTAALAGQMLGFRRGPLPGDIKMLLFHIADNLAQYRAFTKLLRDQGQSITGATGEAAENIAVIMTDMDVTLAHLATAVERDGAGFDRELLVSELRRIRGPIIGILSKLQFQDVTQQQFAFLNRLSLILDDHMIQLARQLGDRRASDRVTGFKEMFERALADCVMASQRDDHRAASGETAREDQGLKVELF
jgi:hypothetical protein